MEQVDKKMEELFIQAVSNTFALNNEQKIDIISHVEELSIKQINEIFDILLQYESLIVKDDLNQKEKLEKEEIEKSLDSLLDQI